MLAIMSNQRAVRQQIFPEATVGLPYRRLSAVAHAELHGLSLNLAPANPGRTPVG